MADASKNDLFGDLSYGDETRRNGDYVALPHDEANNEVKEGEAVTVNGSGNLVRCTSGDEAVGVLSNFERAGDSGGPSDPAPIIQDEDANVKVSGTVKAVVESGVSAGDFLEAGATTDGVFDTAGTQSDDLNFLALSDAVEDDRADGSTVYYAEVRLR